VARITVAGGPSDWRAAFLPHPGMAVTPENYELLTAAPVPEPVPAAAAAAVPPERPAPRTPPRRPPVPEGGDG
jgi:hypothetical protein